MTPQYFLLKFFEIEPERFEQEGDECLSEMITEENSDGTVDEVIRIMTEYARIMCDRQRQLCEFHAETKTLEHNGQSYTTVDSASIRNAPLPEEVR